MNLRNTIYVIKSTEDVILTSGHYRETNFVSASARFLIMS
jgi:hypothetical protein